MPFSLISSLHYDMNNNDGRDHNLIKWMGANSYRTSHYPYAEEILDFADQNGIVIIGLVIFSHHHNAMISLV